MHIGRDDTNWFKQMCEYEFIEGQGFRSITAKSTGGRPGVDHAITVDMCKELGMIQRTELGRQIRRYFIEAEKRAAQNLALPQSHADEPKVTHVDTFDTDNDVLLILFVAQQLGLTVSRLRADPIERSWIYKESQHRRSSKDEVVEENWYSAYSH